MKRRGNNKKAQGGAFGMSFGVMFSIIIIIFILVVAGIAIKSFLDLKNCAQIGLFVKDLQDDIDTARNSQKSDIPFEGTLPSHIEYVCFANLSDSPKGDYPQQLYTDITLYKHADVNAFFYPRTCDVPYHKFKHIDMDKITESKNPNCFKNDEGVVININKGFNDALVSLS